MNANAAAAPTIPTPAWKPDAALAVCWAGADDLVAAEPVAVPARLLGRVMGLVG
jgi:hypothetical protein